MRKWIKEQFSKWLGRISAEEEWTDEELAEIEEFRQFVISRRNATPMPAVPVENYTGRRSKK